MDVSREVFFMIATDDRPGQLGKLMQDLKENSVDLAGLWGFGVGQGRAQILLVAKDADRFTEAAGKLDISYEEGTCYRVTSSDEVGIFVDIFHKATEADINLHAVDAIALNGQVGCYIWCDKENTDALGKLLGV